MNKKEVDTTSEISVHGKFVKVPTINIGNLSIVVTGKILRVGSIKGEAWLHPQQIAPPEQIIEGIWKKGVKIDVFRFSQRLPETDPKHNYHYEWDNVAAIPLATFQDWWENRVSKVTRKNVRRAENRGIKVRSVKFDDKLIESIVEINNDSLYRTGRKFWHFGKDIAAVKKDYSAYIERSEYFGAFLGDELIGFMRLIYQGHITSIMQILSKKAHYDKRPSNALIAKAVEMCVEKGNKFLVYGKFIYDDYYDNPLTEFKRRNGFERYLLPTYYIPFTLKGRAAIKMKIHAGFRRLIPRCIKSFFRKARSVYLNASKRAGQA